VTPVRLPYDEAVRRVRSDVEDERCTFIARVTTPWIVLGLEAWLLKSGGGRKGHVLVVPSAVGAEAPFSSPLADDPNVTVTIAAPRTNRSRIPTNLRRLSEAPWHGLLLARGPTTRPSLDVVSARDPDTGFMLDLASPLLQRNVRIHLIDEGFGKLPVTLGTDVRSNATNARLRAKGSWLHHTAILLGVRARVAAARLVSQRLPSFDHDLIRWDPLSKTTRVDEEVRDAYRAVIASRPRVPIERGTRSSRIAVFATHPLSDYLSTTVETEARVDELVVTTLLSRGFDVVIKPHPRERPLKYEALREKLGPQIRLMPGTLPAEEMFRSLGPDDVVVGYTGQSLLSANVFFGLAAYSLTSTLARFEVDLALLDDYRAYDGALPPGAVRPFEELVGQT
jgi:hypothetical protein